MTTSPYTSDALPDGTVGVVVIGGGAPGLNRALILARFRLPVGVTDTGAPPFELLRRGREQSRQYGAHVVFGEVDRAEPATPSADGGPSGTINMADGNTLTARRVLVATGLEEVLPEVARAPFDARGILIADTTVQEVVNKAERHPSQAAPGRRPGRGPPHPRGRHQDARPY